MRGCSLGLALFILLGSAPAGQSTSSAADLARRIQAHYDQVRSFTADFQQTYKGPLPQTTANAGKLKVLKPGRFRFEYSTEQKQLFISNGVDVKSYNPVDKVGSVRAVPKSDDASTSLMFLAGRGNLTRDFTIAAPATHPDGLFELILTPKRPQDDYVSLRLRVDRTTLQLRGLVTRDAQGAENDFRFTNLRENASLSDKDFEFKFPPGTQVDK
jgi:outer membrane lipoprotein carrier protein